MGNFDENEIIEMIEHIKDQIDVAKKDLKSTILLSEKQREHIDSLENELRVLKSRMEKEMVSRTIKQWANANNIDKFICFEERLFYTIIDVENGFIWNYNANDNNATIKKHSYLGKVNFSL